MIGYVKFNQLLLKTSALMAKCESWGSKAINLLENAALSAESITNP